jgi:hypothetical protein
VACVVENVCVGRKKAGEIEGCSEFDARLWGGGRRAL